VRDHRGTRLPLLVHPPSPTGSAPARDPSVFRPSATKPLWPVDASPHFGMRSDCIDSALLHGNVVR
jgi:hypothetical protein